MTARRRRRPPRFRPQRRPRRQLTRPPPELPSRSTSAGDRRYPRLGSADIDVEQYDVALTYDAGADSLAGHIAVSGHFRNATDQIALDTAGPRVTGVAGDDGELAFTQADDELIVSLATAEPAGAPFAITVDFTSAVPKTGDFLERAGLFLNEDGPGVWSVNEPDGTSTWLPIERPSDRQGDVAIRGHRAGGPVGDRQRRARRDGRRRRRRGSSTWTWDQREPMASYLVLLLIGDYETIDGGRSTTGVELDQRRRTEGRRRRRELRRPRRPPAVVLHRTVRHVPVRSVRHRARRLGLRAGDGDTGHAALQPRRPRRVARATSSTCCWRTSCRTNGSATPCRRRSGTTSGSTRDGPPTPNGCGSTTRDSTRSTARRNARCCRPPTAVARSAGQTTCSVASATTAVEPRSMPCGSRSAIPRSSPGRGPGWTDHMDSAASTDDFQATMETGQRARPRRLLRHLGPRRRSTGHVPNAELTVELASGPARCRSRRPTAGWGDRCVTRPCRIGRPPCGCR